MVLKNFTYLDEKNKKKSIKVKDVSIYSTGLMFRKNSPPLLFDMKENRKFSIHSFFCRRFRAIWINENKKITRVVDVKPWRINIRGRGRYLLEVPL